MHLLCERLLMLFTKFYLASHFKTIKPLKPFVKLLAF